MTKDTGKIYMLNKSRSYKLLEIIAFMTLCLVVNWLKDWHPLSALPEYWRVILGSPPEVVKINIFFLLYSFSVMVMLGAAIIAGKKPEPTWKHLGYRSGFVLFYSGSGEFSVYFQGLITVCLFLYVLEMGHIGLCLHQNRQRQERGLSSRI